MCEVADGLLRQAYFPEKQTRKAGEIMRPVVRIVLMLVMAGAAVAQENPSAAAGGGGKLFFPRNFIWGYGQFDVAPPHNEPDPNICAADAGQFGGKNAPCNAFGRYLLSGYVEVRPFARTQLKRLYFFGAPTFVFGKNIPQTLYTWSPAAIGWERSWGVGVDIARGFEFRVTQHFLFQRFGSRDRYLGPADLGSNGPWGRYAVIGVRKYFGHREAQ
jgi:hypothetical protein